MPPLHLLTATELARGLRKKLWSSTEICRSCLERIDEVDPHLHAYLSRDDADVLAQAGASDARRQHGQPLSEWDGVPVSLKDIIAVKDQPLTGGSRILEKFISPYDAHVTEKLKAAGLILLGRLNLDEFAMGSSTENSAFQVTRNPCDLGRVAGGSSGGSAAAVAAREIPWSLGSDTGGSIRQPAAFCGVLGLKPTYGRISRYGLAAYASSLDQIGPLARSVEDVAALLQIMAGPDRRDSTSVARELPDYRNLWENGVRRKIGIPREYFGEGLDAEVRTAVEKTIARFADLGHDIVAVSLPRSDLAIPVYYIIATAEASSNLSRYDGIRYSSRSERAENSIDVFSKSRGEFFGAEVKRRIILGTYVLSSGYYDAYYKKAQQVRTLLRQDFAQAFAVCDVLLTPVTPTAAFPVGEKSADPLAMYLADIFTISANLAGLPGLAFPCGATASGLPIGCQLLGRAFDESSLLALAAEYESAHPISFPPIL